MSDRKKILLIDDNVLVSKMICETLDGLGCKSITAGSTESARVAFLDNPGRFDLILVDDFLSDAVDPEFVPDLSHIRPDMRIVLYSGGPDGIEDVRVKGTGAVIPGGLSKQEFAEALKRVIEEA